MARTIHSSSIAIRIVAFAVVIVAVYLAKTVLLPVAIAVLLAFALDPIVRRLERPLRYRPLAIGVTIALTGLVGAGLLALAVGQAREFIEKSPEYGAAITHRLSATRAGAAALNRALRDVQTAVELPAPDKEPAKSGTLSVEVQPPKKAEARAPEPAPAPRPEKPTNLFDVAGQAFSVGAVVLITTLLLTVVLLYREDLRDRLVRILGVDSLPLTRRTLEDASQRISRYLLVQAALNTLCGVLIAAGMFALGVPNAALLGITAGMLRFVPYLGPFSAASLAFLTALATSPDWSTPLGVLGIYAGVEAVIAMVLEPWFYGKRTGLSLFGVVVAISFWGWLWGIAGLLVAVPLTVCVVLLARHFPALEPLSILLGDAPPLTPADRFHHRLLSRDAAGASTALAELAALPDSNPDAADEIWLSSLRRAAADAADERLADEDLDAYLLTAGELLLRPEIPAVSTQTAAPGIILFVSSNRLDLLAAEVVRASIARRADVPVRLVEPPVMLKELAASEETQTSRALIVLSVARTSRRRARLLARGLHTRMPAATVILAALAGPHPQTPASMVRGIRYVRSIAELLETLGLPSPVRPSGEAPITHEGSRPRAESVAPAGTNS